MTNYKIEIVSDTVCPWCYVGKNRMDKAIQAHKQKNPNDTFTTAWWPFYLNPDAPKSIDKQQYYEAKFGVQRTRVMQGHLARLGKQVGIDFAFGGKTGNTRDSHRLIQLGKTKGEEMQTKVVEQLFNAYFEKNEDITTQDVLIERGIKAGLDEAEVRDWLQSGKGGEEVDREVAQAQTKFITGVPNFTINGKYEIQGAEEPAAFLQVFEEVKETMENGSAKVGGQNILDLPPSCVAFCPTSPEHFVVGTYFLHPKDEQKNTVSDAIDGPNSTAAGADGNDEAQKRSGSLVLYRLAGDRTVHIATELTPTFSILDIEWSPHVREHGTILAVATSTGSLAFYRLQAEDSGARLQWLCEKQICDASILVLDLVWHPSQANVIAVTLSDGRVGICEDPRTTDSLWSTDDEPLEITDVTQHDLEAWTLAFAPDPTTMGIFSGGDDAILRCTRSVDQEFRGWHDRRSHHAGVTAILPLTSDLILTGSYDDHIRLISAPIRGRRTVLAESNLGGGVWRLKLFDPAAKAAALPGTPASAAAVLSSESESARSLFILASCMHAGSRVVRLSRSHSPAAPSAEHTDWSFEVMAKVEEHKSMNYGSDIQPGDGTADADERRLKTVVSTSFYDKLMCLWRVDIGTE
ncbi:DSBA-like thioredoxin domain [Teratosphaeria destructans]|uniref:DSBA-like thioredoxin domain n=1 Tax=Teratosphaeria destructans TaxID=418781 RepID=A0A9W7SS23_9PEZI|nr:DSBA-like thioredoxin domain [Teratosphaeria destructans]